MTPTPRKNPGRVNNDKSKTVIVARKALKRPPGRPLQLAKKARCSEQESGPPAKRQRKNRTKKTRMSALESLPTEILASIFLYCMNFDLPRCSPVIRTKLSTPVIYKRIVMAAFGPVWHVWHGQSDHFPPKTSAIDISEDESIVIRDRPGDHALQAQILRCQWATAEILVAAKEHWIRKHARNTPFKPLLFLEKPQISDTPSSASSGSELAETEDISKDLAKQESSGLSILADRTTSLQELFEKDYIQFCQAVELDEDSIASAANWDKYNDIHYRTEIPGNLLAGPWTEEMVRKLFWLVRGGASVQRTIESTSTEAALEGFFRAIECGDLRILRLLDWMQAVRRPSLIKTVRVASHAKEGCDKVRVVNRALHHGHIEDRLNRTTLRDFMVDLGRLGDEAYRNGDRDTMALILAVERLPENLKFHSV
ncbi:hypothetical protein PVAG01_06459 [Phlyctema vagabunda]|uniref:F-box domain-containing protein n=1 Tax=Phlyctema vagabunda TaxID=108571 RepID=A0ABR4PG95_9HELO